MIIIRKLGSLALQQVAGDWIKDFLQLAESHFTDHSQRLTTALTQAHERAWKTLEIALGGKRFWDRFASVEDKALREQVQAFLQGAVPADNPDFLGCCLKELRLARDREHLTATGSLSPAVLVDDVSALGRFDDPAAVLAAECRIVGEVAAELKRLGYAHLGRLLAVTPTRGQPLLAVAVQYYFRRAVGADKVLARELTWTRLGSLDRQIEDGFAFLALIQERQSQIMEQALEGLARLAGVAVETRDAVFDVHADVLLLTNQVKLLRRDLSVSHSISYRDDNELRLIEEVKRHYRALSDDQRLRFPQLGLDISRLEIVEGDFPAALTDAREAARRLGDPPGKAEAHHAAYRAALELRQWDEALAELQKTIALDPRFAPYPTHGLEVLRILGAGGFGVAFLCRNRYSRGQVVIKAFEAEEIDRDVAEIFREAQVLEGLRHPGIIRLLDCGFADPVREQRPFLKLEHFEDSTTLEDHVQRHGPLKPDDLLPIARLSAAAIQAAHQSGVLHRDVKPANLLVRKSTNGWEVRLIDFGLSLRRSLVQSTMARASTNNRSMVGSAVAGTLHYAAPEQLDKGSSRRVGPHSDVYGFGRTCLYALFGMTRPRAKLIRDLPDPWPDLLDDCCDEQIEGRPPDFAAVLERLTPGGEVLPTPALPSSSQREHSQAKALQEARHIAPPRKAGPAQPAEASAAEYEAEASDAIASVDGSAAAQAEVTEEPAAVHPAPPANVPKPSTLGPPLTLKEKLAAARAGGAAQRTAPASTRAPAAKTVAPAPAVEEAVEAAPAEAPQAVPAPARPLGRRASVKEILEAARGAGATPAASSGAAKPIAPNPAPAAAKAGAGRVLAPLEKISDPRDIAEAARQTSRVATVQPASKITNSIGMALTLIKAGKFMMGSDATDPDARDDEFVDKASGKKEKHRVRITRPFYLGTTQVTRGQFGRFVDDAGYRTDAEKDGKGGHGWYEKTKTWVRNPKYTWRNVGFEQTDEQPVVNVSWNDAVAFAQWLSRKEGTIYRLPTEAEWEYACRAGTDSVFPWGDDRGMLDKHVWYSENSGNQTHPVGRKKPNAWGLHDMVGNVWEWCSDCYAADYYKQSPVDDPPGAEDGSNRVHRGASWINAAVNCRAAYRYGRTPASTNCHLGMRLARVLSGR
jgi:formylglycine-generating enzyme required for sulfatase activity/tRNA A-37 threonylcarbamoyl transferase component Bud32